MTEAILATFRANGLLLAVGDVLTKDRGLTSARWQVLGALVLGGDSLTVPQIARRMGLTRQSVHATVNRLVSDGLVELASNADHRRSQLVRLTSEGRASYEAVDRRQQVWVARLAKGIGSSRIESSAKVLEEIADRLEVELETLELAQAREGIG